MGRAARCEVDPRQFLLFVGLAVPEAQPRRPVAKRPAPVLALTGLQLEIDYSAQPAWIDPDDIPEDGDFPEHRWTRAADCDSPKTTAPASIWDLGSSIAAAQVINEFRLRPRAAKAHPEDRQPIRPARIIREGDTVRHVAMRVQETDEWQEKERARRARQVLPKPPKQTFRLKKKEAA